MEIAVSKRKPLLELNGVVELRSPEGVAEVTVDHLGHDLGHSRKVVIPEIRRLEVDMANVEVDTNVQMVDPLDLLAQCVQPETVRSAREERDDRVDCFDRDAVST